MCSAPFYNIENQNKLNKQSNRERDLQKKIRTLENKAKQEEDAKKKKNY